MNPHRIKPALDLSRSLSFAGKLQHIIDYFSFEFIYCYLPKDLEFDYPFPKEKLRISSIAVPPARSSYIKVKMQECLPALEVSLEEYLRSDNSFKEIESRLSSTSEQCL